MRRIPNYVIQAMLAVATSDSKPVNECNHAKGYFHASVPTGIQWTECSSIWPKERNTNIVKKSEN